MEYTGHPDAVMMGASVHSLSRIWYNNVFGVRAEFGGLNGFTCDTAGKLTGGHCTPSALMIERLV